MNHMKRTGLVIALSVAAGSAEAQLGMFSKEQRAAITSEWTGERFPDGRPKVPDTVLERMKEVTAEEAWGVLTEAATSCSSRAAGRRSTPGRRGAGWSGAW